MEPTAPSGFYMDGDPHVHPSLLVDHYCRERGFERADFRVKPVVLGTFHPDLTRFLAQSANAEPAERWAAWKGDGFVIDDAVTLLTLPIGAPSTVAMMEELYACGMRTLITTGSSGSLQPHAPIGSIVLPAQAIREEGTSHHYAPHDVPAVADPEALAVIRERLDELAIPYIEGMHWTTDAIYREHRQKVDRYRRAGVITVDMELSAIYTVGAVIGVRCAAVVAVSDELHGDTWEMGFASDTMRRGMIKAGRVALHAALTLAGAPPAA